MSWHLLAYYGGGSEIGRIIAHAAIWTVVSQTLRRLPAPVYIAAAVLACVYLLWSRRRHQRRPAREREYRR